MAIAQRGTAVSNNARSTSISASFTIVSGDFLICGVASSTGTTINTPTGGGGTWTPVAAAATNGTTAVRLFWSIPTLTGAQTISCTTNTGRDSEICVAAFTGVKTTSPVDATANGTGLSVSITTLTANDLIIVVGGGANNAAFTVGTIGGTTATLLTSQGGTPNADQGAIGMEFLVVTTAQAYTCNFAAGAATQAIQAAAFIDASAGGGGGTTVSLLSSLGAGS